MAKASILSIMDAKLTSRLPIRLALNFKEGNLVEQFCPLPTLIFLHL